MAKRVWKDRIVARPRTFTIQENQDGTITLIPAPGEIIQEGTPINAANLNGLEEDLESHKAEIASQAEPNKIPRALASGKLDIDWIPSDGGWELIAEHTILENTTQFDFINIPDEYKMLKLYFYFTSASNISPLIVINDDTNSNYSMIRERILGGGSNTTEIFSTVVATSIQLFTGYGPNYGCMEISNQSADQRKIYHMQYYTHRVDSEQQLLRHSGLWKNQTSKINKISIINSVSSLRVNTFFMLWGCK
jgi:hypothetical protein